jgi:hypothetical protein
MRWRLLTTRAADDRSYQPILLNSNTWTNRTGESPSFAGSMPAVNFNTGNSYIAYSVLKNLFGSERVAADLPAINNIWEDSLAGQAERINDGHDRVLLFLQDQIRADNSFEKWEKLNSFVEKIDVPLVVFSLGANSFTGWDAELHSKLNPGLVRFLHLLADRTVSLGIRGAFTAEVLTKLGIRNFQITGCPSYFECGRGRRVFKPKWEPNRKVLATGLFSTADAAELHYVLQSEPVLLKALFNGVRELTPTDTELLDASYPGYRESVTKALRDERVSLFFDPSRWKAFIARKFSYAIGTRLHGSIIALNAGIPALVTNGDMRAREVTEYLGIPLCPGICGCDFSLRELYEEMDIDAMNARYDSVFDDYCAWLRVNGLALRDCGDRSDQSEMRRAG